ncbi:fatty acid--CoA ligase [Kineobactrum sediminis]|uniref:Fatty acid--CoA ligase n=1 Tax=Kineobactrum sediminis TaxID=1905677 RepID=A0A2N5XZU5_9GAMM|nr:FadD3 family acyl-CoA ligase [Kineobactrum sediminis]PLW81668.1 fatty acid--CoA ligase [Kineobactrum sediminis]
MSSNEVPQQTVPEVVAATAAALPDHIAIIDGDVTLTYAELDSARITAAKAFLALGLEHGERIAIWAPNLYQWIVAAIGAQSVGGVLVPLNTRLKGPEAAYILRRSGARWLFTVPEFLGMNYPAMLRGEDLPALEGTILLAGDAGGAQSWEDFLLSGARVSPAQLEARVREVQPGDVLDILFTSGTTGKPKGVVTSHGQNIRAFATWGATVGLTEHDNYLIINPFFHSFGYKAGWLAALIRGARIVPVQQFDLDTVLAQIDREQISVIPGPPTIYQSLLSHPRRRDYDLSSLRLAVTGAAPVPVSLIEKMRSELGFKVVVTAYGLTESCGVISICRPEDSAERISHTSGRAMAGVEMKCVDAEGNSVAPGTEGEIWCRGYNVMQGYLDDPIETSHAITSDGWLRTGDVGVMDSDGYVRITDRIKDMFIVGGFNCYPAEIENTLHDMPGVTRAAVIGVADERLGEVARAYIVPAAGAELSEEMVIKWCREQMANYKVPRSVRLVSELPMNAGGKVLKTVLREWSMAEQV